MSFPWLTHRSMKEVAQTEYLLELKRHRPLTGLRARRLDQLLDLADKNNPPPDPKPDSAA
jgi:hypothetical protein